MADNKQAPGAGEAAPTTAEYKKAQARVRELVEKRRGLDRKLVSPPNIFRQYRKRKTAMVLGLVADTNPGVCVL